VAQEKIDPKVLFIIGPTAVGKSDLAIKLAKELNGEIISADSMQIYKHMDIGTAKPSKEELESVPHHLIDIKDPKEYWSVTDFVEQTHLLIGVISAKKKLPIVVGGTGMYLFALLEGFSFPEIKKNEALREELENIRLPILYEQLKDVDPIAAAKINPNDKKRIIRALEVFELTGQPMSSITRSGAELPFTPIMIGLNMDREKLNNKIELRIDKMLKDGLIDEVKGLVARGCNERCTSMQAIGYKEVIEHLEGRTTKDEMILKLKQDTRNFAKRQMTWFKRFKNVTWYDAEKLSLPDIIGYVSKTL
jgi:tRNA dimethylallyltransferase